MPEVSDCQTDNPPRLAWVSAVVKSVRRMTIGNYPSVPLREQTGSRKRMAIPPSMLSLHRASSLNFDPFSALSFH